MIDAIFNRRSIRKYTGQPVTDETIETLLRAGMAAPSAGNEQPWHFVVIRDRATLEAITRFHPYAQMLHGADCAIVVCGDTALERYRGFWVQDCSAAAENMLLTVQDLGLGSVWVGVYPMADRVEPLKQLLGLPESVIPLGILPLGYPAEQKNPANRFNPERIHRDRW